MLEDGGGDGSAGGHFEKLIFGDETMVSDDVTDARFSKMSLAVGKDSGFYEIDLETGDNYFWAKDQGCKLMDNTCSVSDVNVFCSTDGNAGCSPNRMYTTTCTASQYTGNCNISLNTKLCKLGHTAEVEAFGYGPNAICLNGEVRFIFYWS
jgi:hypothetical protein